MVGPVASSKTLQIRFKCGVENQAYKSAHNAVLQVPAHLGRKSLTSLLHTLLNLSEQDRPDFHFLVDEVPLRTTLDKFLERRHLSFENTLSLTYFIPIAEPSRESSTHISQNWISSLHAHADGRVLVGLFSGRSSIVHDDTVILTESSLPHSHDAPVKAVQWLNDNHFLTASSDETACGWRLQNGEAELVSRMDTSEINPASFSAASVKKDSTTAALGCMDGSLWLAQDCIGNTSDDHGDKKRKAVSNIPASRVTDGVLRVTGLLWRGNDIVSVGWDGFTGVFCADTCTKKTTIPSGGKPLTSVASLDGNGCFIVSAVDGAVRMIDGRSGKGVVAACGKREAHQGIVTAIAAQDELVVSTGVDGTVKFWDQRSMLNPQHTIRADGKLFAVDLIRGTRNMVFAGGQTGEVLRFGI